jgi:hypothetical protein
MPLRRPNSAPLSMRNKFVLIATYASLAMIQAILNA